MIGTWEADDAVVTLSVACSSAEEAAAIARALVGRRLAACAQAWPIESTYRWQGKVETAREQLLVVKTLKGALSGVEALVRELHSYELPEMVAQPAAWVSPDYAAWVRTNVELQ